ncbi:hypothetical protein BIY29_12355 [Brenneria alni]|uniref:Uncharacterized protein n=1 Tax=Brenneria alni TaxID=71656 RepID=A0A421DML9_9GAMM|nr:hypothetical protein BIY29_12355 [Brenneria alni]
MLHCHRWNRCSSQGIRSRNKEYQVGLEVAFTHGDERYTTFTGEEIIMPENEVSFIDEQKIAHARKWSHKQNAVSVITDQTLI